VILLFGLQLETTSARGNERLTRVGVGDDRDLDAGFNNTSSVVGATAI
jgi:hypothetical protein